MDTSIYNSNKISDVAILQNIGSFVQQIRISQNKTQAQVAAAAGVHRSTMVKLESGNGVQLLSLIQILRALNQLQVLATLHYEPSISPIAMVKMQLARRKRASKTTF